MMISRTLASVVLLGAVTAAAHATPVTINVSGSIGQVCSPPANVGTNPVCTQNAFNLNNPGSPLFSSTLGSLNVSGTVTYDSVTFAMSSMTLSQVGSYVGNTGSTYSTQDVITYSGLQWSWNATQGGSGGPALRQTAATVSCSDNNTQDAVNPGCPNPATQYLTSWVVNNGSDLNNSLFDFTGVPAGYAINSNLVPIAQQDGVQSIINNGSTITANLVGTTGNSLFLYHTVSRATLTLSLDTDGDGVPDAADNCTLLSNANQRDTNGDGYGNLCDPDLNNDGTVNINDFNRLKARLGIVPVVDVDADLDGNGAVNINDLNRLKSFLGKPPGPSGLHPNCPPTCP